MVSRLEGSSPFPPYEGPFRLNTPYFYIPTLLLAFVATTGLVRYLKTKQTVWQQDIFSNQLAPNKRVSPLSKLVIVLACLVPITFLFDTGVVLARVFLEEENGLCLILMYYIGISWLAWIINLVCLMDESHKFYRWYWLQYAFFGLALLGEALVGWLWNTGYRNTNPGTVLTLYDHLLLGIFMTRYVLEVAVFILSLVQWRNTKRQFDQEDNETSPLLNSESNYGATTATNNDETITTAANNVKKGGVHVLLSKLRKVMPYIWPHNDRKLQNLVVICFLLMCLGLCVNVWTPLQIGRIVDSFNNEPETFAWAAVLAYVGFKFLQGTSGLVQAVQNWLWIPIGQFTTREVSVKLFAHLHSLSLHYHINRKTGEVLRVVDRGTSSIVQLLSQIVFQIFPALANILIAVVVFSVHFSIPFGAIVFVTMSLYLYTTITLTEWRTSFRRKMNELDNYARTKAVDSLLNFETVKYYNAEGFEVHRYDNAIVEYQKADYKNSVSLNVLNLAQNAVITSGLLAGCLLFAFEVSRGNLTAGDFVSFNVYMMQLYTPLHFFGTYYRMIQQNFIDMEKMFDLFEVDQTVKDAEGAGELHVTEGHVKFDHVSFAYDNRQTALNQVSFSIPKGATVALVGPSGGGKSTIMRLLFRFYDPLSGHIYIDGQDIAKVQQSSLRKNIGVVPQDTVLFNDTIMYNIRYGDVNASDEDVYRAAKAAQIHEKILSFPDGYDTKVGERGLRLSGGEKQRVAIARTILKNPPIILLDEATSALDTTTERYIQEALADMTKNRTTLVIAHRLSTIVNADLILVIKDGQVVESGSHEQLVQSAIERQNQGVYYEMWQKQLDDNHHHDLSETLSESSSAPKHEKDQQPQAQQEQEQQQKEGSKPFMITNEGMVDEPEQVETTKKTIEADEEETTGSGSSSSNDDKDNTMSMTPLVDSTVESEPPQEAQKQRTNSTNSNSRRNSKKKKRRSKK